MNKDFPLLLFPSLNENDNENDFLSLIHKNAEQLLKLNFNQPIDATYNDETHDVNCLSQKFYSNSLINPISPIQPWDLPKPIHKIGMDPYFDLKEINRSSGTGICCKKTIAYFYINRFGNGTNGKCIYMPKYGIWVTPVDFQYICGSTQADWKASLTFTSDSSNKKKTLKSFKSLINDETLQLHPISCDCAVCLDFDYIKDENVNFLSSFFMNDSQLIHLYPNCYDISSLTIELNNYKNLKDLESRSITDSANTRKVYNINFEKTNLHNRNRIKQINTQLIDEFKNEEFLTYINLNNTEIKILVSNLSNDENESFNLETKIIHESDFDKKFISSVAPSPHINAESAILLGNNNKIYLQVLRDGTTFDYFKVVKDLQPNFESTQSNWKNILFGSHPRNLIYADYSKLCTIDTRLKNANVVEIFNLNSELNRKFLSLNELVERNCLVQSNLYAHVICCSNTLVILDERYTTRPVLTWKHHLNLKPIHLNVFNLNDTNNNVILCSDLNEIYAYQFNLNDASIPISYNFPYKLDNLDRDFDAYLPDNYDRRLRRHFNSRFKQPILSMSVLQDFNKFALFQMQPNEDLYYQIFKIDSPSDVTFDREMEVDQDDSVQTANFESWLDVIRQQVLIKDDYSLEAELRNLYFENSENIYDQNLPNKSENCKICNYESSADLYDSTGEICDRCSNYVKFTAIITNEDTSLHLLGVNDNKDLVKIIDFDQIELPTDENSFTNEIYSIWKDDIDDILNKTTANDKDVSNMNDDLPGNRRLTRSRSIQKKRIKSQIKYVFIIVYFVKLFSF